MLSILKKLLSPDPRQAEAHAMYAQLVSQARAPEFFRDWGVPDTLDGRFDVVVLYVCAKLHQLKSQAADPELLRALQEAFFTDMDRNLREMGVSDTGVGKRMKKMTQAFFGRLQAYENAFESEAALKAAIAKNLYRGEPVADSALKAVCDKIRTSATLS